MYAIVFRDNNIRRRISQFGSAHDRRQRLIARAFVAATLGCRLAALRSVAKLLALTATAFRRRDAAARGWHGRRRVPGDDVIAAFVTRWRRAGQRDVMTRVAQQTTTTVEHDARRRDMRTARRQRHLLLFVHVPSVWHQRHDAWTRMY